MELAALIFGACFISCGVGVIIGSALASHGRRRRIDELERSVADWKRA